MPPEEDDPVIASYDIYITNPQRTTDSKPPKLFVLQYPSHRPSSKPYNTAHFQHPTSFRIKPKSGLFELDVPIPTSNNYNTLLGTQLGRAMQESKVAHPTTSHGLSGGFVQHHHHHHHNANHPINLTEVPDHDPPPTALPLQTQTLGGKLSEPSSADPIYMLATLSSSTKQLYLQHLDAVIQMRPQLHHIDASDDLKRRTESSNAAATNPIKPKPELIGPDGKVKLETKAIEMKIKDSSKDDPKDRNLNLNAQLLRNIQNEPWQKYNWVEKHEHGGLDKIITSPTHDATTAETAQSQPPRLKSALDNDEWLNRMSSPGIELRTRLKGRDRERARRKRQERLKGKGKPEAMSGGGAITGGETAGSESSASDDEDADIDGQATGGEERTKSPEVQIKQEGAGSTNAVAVAAAANASAPKRRGRPPKNKKTEIVTLD